MTVTATISAAVNTPPTIDSTEITTATENSPYSYTFAASDVDAGDTLTLSAPVIPIWMSFNASTGALTGTPTNAEVGTHNVTLRVNDGTVDVDQVFAVTVANVNDAPTIDSVAVTTATEDTAYSYTFIASDVDASDTLTLSAPVLPGWMSFNASTGALTGTPANGDVGANSVTLSVFDGTVNVDQIFVVTVANINDAPTIDSTAVTSATEGSAYSYAFAASDVDAGDTLTYSAPVLPGWMSFNSGTGALIGTPNNAAVGLNNVTLRVTDGTVTVDQVFVVSVANVNDAPTINSVAVTAATEDAAYSYTFSASDVDAGDTLTYSAPVLPGWMSFNAGSGALAGTPLNGDVGANNVTLRVFDGTVNVDQVFVVTVANTNDAPIVNSVENTTAAEGSAYNYVFSASDVDAGDTLTYSAPVLPAWLSFNAGSGALTGTPTNAEVGPHNVTLRVTDGTVNVEQIFVITVANTNNAPTIDSTVVTTATEDVAYSYTFAASDADAGAVLTYSAPVLPGWMSFNAGSGALTGTPTNAEVGPHNVTLRVNDGVVDVDQVFVVTVANTNDAPTIDSTAVTTATEDAPYSYTFAASDVDAGASLIYSAPVLPTWMSFNAGTGALTGTPLNGDVGANNVTLRVFDGTVNVDQVFVVTVANTNDAPTIDSQNAVSLSEDSSQAISFADLNVTDIDADDIYPAGFTLNVLPGANYSLNGSIVTPTPDFNGNLTVPVVVNDGVADSNIFNLTVTVIPANDAPTIDTTAVTAATEGSAYSYTFAASDIDAGDTLTSSAPVLPGWMSFNAGSGALTGTPTNAEVGPHNVTLRVTDGTVNVDQVFVVTVANTNDAPTINSVAVTAATEDAAYSYTFSASDVDASDTLTYSAPVLPGWMSFNAGSGALTGTPLNGDVGANNVTLRVSDGTVNVDQVFVVTVANTNDAPTINSVENATAAEGSAYNYVFSASDVDAGDTLTYSAPVLPAWLSFNAGSGALTGTPLNGDVGPHNVTLRVTDGTVNVEQIFVITVANTNNAPTIDSTVVTTATEDVAYSYTFAASDVDAGAILTYSAPVLPGWMSFNAGSGALTGTPTNAEVGPHNVTLRVNDGVVDVDQVFVVTVANTNDAPTIDSTAVTTATEDAPYSYTFAASDVDAGASLIYSAPVLPTWMSFNAGIGALTGIPTNAEVGSHNVTLRVTDGTVNVDQTFVVSVANTNDVPTINSVSVTAATEDAAYSYTFSASDVDASDTLTYSAPVLPGWMSFNAGSGALTGTPLNGDVGANNVTLRVSDGTVNVDQVFVVSVANTNDAPTIDSVENTTAAEGSAYNYVFSASDVDTGDTLTYSAPVLPAWLSFNAGSGALTGTPLNGDVGPHNVTLRVTDGTVNVEQIFVITVANTNNAPTIDSTAVTTATEDVAYSYTITASDADAGAVLAFTAPVLPSWMSFNAGTATLTGTPTNAEVGNHNVTLRVNDGVVDVDQIFVITVTNVNDAPTITSTAVTSATEDVIYSYTFTASDVDAGNVLTLSAPVLPTWLSFNTTSGLLSGTPTNSNVGNSSVTLRVSDGTVNVDQIFVIAVANVNDAPTINSVAVTAANEDAAYSYTFSASDVDAGATLTYSAPVLPTWMSFNAGSGALTGTPLNGDVGANNVTLRVFDGTVNVDQVFVVTVANTNDAPTINSVAVTAATEDAAYSYTFSASDVDALDPLIYSAPVLPTWMSFNAGSGALTGTPTNAEVGPHNVTLRVTDGAVNVDQVFVVTVGNVNDAPTIDSVENTTAAEGSAYNYVFSASDVDTGDTLTYSAPVLPAWLSFNAGSGALTGTPLNGDVGPHNVTLRVTDGTVNVEQIFVITVANTNNAPTIDSTVVTTATEDVAYSYTFAASDADVGAVLTYSAPVLPTWMNFNAGSGALTGTPTNAEVGPHNVTLRVNDGVVDVDQVFVVTVANTNDAPVITGQSALSLQEDASLAIVLTNLTVMDVDNTYPIGFTLTVQPGVNYILAGNTLTPTANYNGTLSVPVIVNDGTDNSNTYNLAVTVTAQNDAPVITGQNGISLQENTSRAIVFADLNVTDADNSYPSGFSLVVQSGADYSLVGNTLTPAPGFVGALTVPVVVNDGTANSNTYNLGVNVTAIPDLQILNFTGVRSNTDTLPVTLDIINVVPGGTVLLEQFIDANNNASVDADEAVIQRYLLTDGVLSANTGIPGDQDGLADGMISVNLNFGNSTDLLHCSGNFVVKVSQGARSASSPLTLAESVAGSLISGVVTDGLNPVAGALVRVEDLDDMPSVNAACTITDASGAYQIRTGGFTVAVRAYGLAADGVTGEISAGVENAQTFLLAGDLAGVNRTLAASDFRITGVLTDSAANPVPGVLLIATDVSDGSSAVAVTDVTGAYTLGAQNGRTYMLNLLADGEMALHPSARGAISYSDPMTTVGPVTADTNGIDFVLPVSTRLVEGTVLANGGGPFGAPVVPLVATAKASSGTPKAMSLMNADSRFGLGLLSNMLWDIEVDHDFLRAHGLLASRITSFNPLAGSLTGNDITIYASTEAVYGVVTDASDSSFLTQVKVTAVNLDNGVVADTFTANQGGSYISSLFAANWEVTFDATAQGYQLQTITLTPADFGGGSIIRDIALVYSQKADLVIENVIGMPAVSGSDTSFNVDVNLKNAGLTDTMAHTFVGVFLSGDATVTRQDRMIGYAYLSDLKAGDVRGLTIPVSMPTNIGGNYTIGVIADFYEYIDEDDRNNNVWTAGFSFNVTANHPDLVINNVGGLPGSLVLNSRFTATVSASNIGLEKSDESTFIGIYLSDDATITPQDMMIGYVSLASLAKGTTGNYSIPCITPGSLSGPKFIGAFIDFYNYVKDENDETNNSWSAASATGLSNIVPDLQVTAANVPASFGSGENFAISFNVVNTGSVDYVGTTHVGLYLSVDAVVTTADMMVGYAFVTNLKAGESRVVNGSAWLPKDLGGSYTMGAYIDFYNYAAESSETNNSWQEAAPRSVSTNRPDLVISSIDPLPTSGVEGSIYSVGLTVTNQGNAVTEKATYVGIFLSADANVTPADRQIGYALIYGANPGQSQNFTFNIRLPVGTTGDYYLGGIVDFYDYVKGESDEGNNGTAATAVTITPLN